MKSAVSLTLLFSTAAILNAADLQTNQTPDLTVHEWGTFTSVAGLDGAAIDWDVLGGKDDLPSFVNDRGHACFKFRLTGTVRMETPVLYFYSPQRLNAHVRVAFPQGLITEWYPQADYRVDQRSNADGALRPLQPNLNGIDTSTTSLIGGIEWKNVKVEPNTSPVLPREDHPSRYYAARLTDAAPVTVGLQHEQFLFYRGVGRFPVPISARLPAGGQVVVANLGSDPIPMVMLFERRGDRFGYRMTRVVSASISLDPPPLTGDTAQLHDDLENALEEQGLFRKEAKAMIETWNDSWFEEGSRLVYIVPPATVDAILPLQIDPVPCQVTRVFVGRIELITHETMRSVSAAIATNDQSVIARYGRFLDPILKRMSGANPATASQIDHFREHLQTSFAAKVCR